MAIPLCGLLCSLVHLSNIPVFSESEEPLVTFDIHHGWKAVVFYDCGQFDYIDSFISPEGVVLDFWDWPDTTEKQMLIDWNPNCRLSLHNM
jgi:hypothetical protein